MIFNKKVDLVEISTIQNIVPVTNFIFVITVTVSFHQVIEGGSRCRGYGKNNRAYNPWSCNCSSALVFLRKGSFEKYSDCL